MKYEYTGRHIEVTEALRAHVEEQFNKIDHLFKGKPAKAHVIIEVERGRHRSEIIVKWRNEVLTAETNNSDMYLSLSQTIAKIEKQALKLKNKVIDKSHKAKKMGSITGRVAEVSPTPNSPRIIRTRRYSVKPMTAEEAILELDAQDNTFLVFRNAENERTSVIYSRKDGNYGLIEP
ncbi:MAG: ribosome-associated translation inhibitor RaiA [Blastocatellia bacterium]|nr:ribosome-associated translation inhibitor RaiA [Chloracidobacterium sp.]MBL8184652.1 ribosome-associated translation inhibitor RaiA [Blastocatellia bacterium]HBE81683.1 ribosome-associated translation inhibitor RaiA [Blastocatellia bacterium]HRJ87565.1 ribosome-associated translation inhibitor RaiA [Pyrinomonadaceae bacterium]HRK50522.1 ribosome-associated translation inhibitor RaiA [Pyrinomonadaceae bacterium]